jgi:hypothetical protein
MSKPPLRSGFSTGVCGVMNKMYKVLIFLILLLPNYLYASISGIDVGMSIAEVENLKGKPTSIESILDWFDYVYKYEKFELHVLRDKKTIVGVASSYEGVCLNKEICVGNKLDISASFMKEFEKWTAPAYSQYQFARVKEGDTCRRFIKVKDMVIKEVATLCSPD